MTYTPIYRNGSAQSLDSQLPIDAHKVSYATTEGESPVLCEFHVSIQEEDGGPQDL